MSLIIPAATINRNLIGTIAGGLIGGIGGLVTGTGVISGAQTGARIGDALTGGTSTPPAGRTSGAGTPGGINLGGFTGFNFGPSSGGTTGTPNAPGQCAPGVAKCNPCGVYGHGSHLNTRTLQPSKKHGVQAPGTWCVRRRHMNPANFRALRRADRRAHAFLRMSTKVVRHFTAKAKKGRAYVHFKKRSR